MSQKKNGEEQISQINQSTAPAPCALIVDRDPMTSNLLADAMVRNLKCDTAAIHSSDLLRTLATRKIDIVVIGADLPPGPRTGFDLSDAVCRAHPEVTIVILLNGADHESVIDAFRSGARGVFSRQQPITEFLACIEHVKKGYIWAGKEETNSLLEAFKSIPSAGRLITSTSPPLTKREFEVVECAAKGKTNRAIAKELGLSEHTVKNYLFRAFDKLGISSRVELLFYLTLRGHTFGARHKPDGRYVSSVPPLARSSHQEEEDRGQELGSSIAPMGVVPGSDCAGPA
jgi:two-component system, NarL family, nitrate/nitrite response regulator NarL